MSGSWTEVVGRGKGRRSRAETLRSTPQRTRNIGYVGLQIETAGQNDNRGRGRRSQHSSTVPNRQNNRQLPVVNQNALGNPGMAGNDLPRLPPAENRNQPAELRVLVNQNRPVQQAAGDNNNLPGEQVVAGYVNGPIRQAGAVVNHAQAAVEQNVQPMIVNAELAGQVDAQPAAQVHAQVDAQPAVQNNVQVREEIEAVHVDEAPPERRAPLRLNRQVNNVQRNMPRGRRVEQVRFNYEGRRNQHNNNRQDAFRNFERFEAINYNRNVAPRTIEDKIRYMEKTIQEIYKTVKGNNSNYTSQFPMAYPIMASQPMLNYPCAPATLAAQPIGTNLYPNVNSYSMMNSYPVSYLGINPVAPNQYLPHYNQAITQVPQIIYSQIR